jgi:hypothetical protein
MMIMIVYTHTYLMTYNSLTNYIEINIQSQKIIHNISHMLRAYIAIVLSTMFNHRFSIIIMIKDNNLTTLMIGLNYILYSIRNLSQKLCILC